MAQDAPTTRAAAAKGRVSSVDGMIITVKGKKGVESTITTDANTTFKLDGKTVTLADVKKGERVVSVTPTDGTATEVDLASGGKKKKKSDDAPPTTPAANPGN
jgi:hypothetical protein